MDSVIITGKEPRLLQLTLWVETQYEKDSNISVQVGARAPLIHHDYIPLSKIYFYDLATEDDLPVFLVSYNNLKIPIDACEYKEGTPSRIGNEDITVHFVFNFVTNLKILEQKYCSLKESEQKFTRGQGLSNFIRAQSQFLSLFERNQEIEEIKVAEIEEQKYERQICNEIIKLQRTAIDIKIMLMLLVLFGIFGYLYQAIEGSRSQAYHQRMKQSRKSMKRKSTRSRQEISSKKYSK